MKFEMDAQQEEKFKKWAETQPKQHYRAGGLIGESQFEFIFTPTGCGMCLEVKNKVNGEILDLTDWDSF